MASLTINQLISQQAYSNHYNRHRLIGIEEDDLAITHNIDFHLNEQHMLVARVQHCLENSKLPPIITIKESKIYYLTDRTSLMPGSGVPRAAAPLSQSPQKWEIISKISERTLVVVDVDIDQKYYARLNNSSKSLDPSLENKTYILLASPPVHRDRTISLKSEDPLPKLSSFENSPSREEEALEKAPTTPPPYRLKLYLSQTPEEKLDS